MPFTAGPQISGGSCLVLQPTRWERSVEEVTSNSIVLACSAIGHRADRRETSSDSVSRAACSLCATFQSLPGFRTSEQNAFLFQSTPTVLKKRSKAVLHKTMDIRRLTYVTRLKINFWFCLPDEQTVQSTVKKESMLAMDGVQTGRTSTNPPPCCTSLFIALEM